MYSKKYFTYKKGLNALKMQLEKIHILSKHFAAYVTPACDLQGAKRGTLQYKKRLKNLPSLT